MNARRTLGQAIHGEQGQTERRDGTHYFVKSQPSEEIRGTACAAYAENRITAAAVAKTTVFFPGTRLGAVRRAGTPETADGTRREGRA